MNGRVERINREKNRQFARRMSKQEDERERIVRRLFWARECWTFGRFVKVVFLAVIYSFYAKKWRFAKQNQGRRAKREWLLKCLESRVGEDERAEWEGRENGKNKSDRSFGLGEREFADLQNYFLT